MVSGPHRATQARILSKVKVQNDGSKTKQLQKSMIQWVMDNPDKVEAMNDMITNGQVDMYIKGVVSDNMGSKEILRRCNSWGKIGLQDKKKVLFSGKHMPSAIAKKVAKSSEEKERLWVFMTARKKNMSLAPRAQSPGQACRWRGPAGLGQANIFPKWPSKPWPSLGQGNC